MKTLRWITARRAIVALIVCSLSPVAAPAQTILADLASPSNRADYVIIAPASYVGALRPLAEHRAQHDGMTVVFALTDSIARQFHAATPDSAVRAFVARSLSAWADPKPAFFLLGGNINAVPGHRVASELNAFGEDSVLLDSWFVLAEDPAGSGLQAAAAIGRFPAWDADELRSMVAKTTAYVAESQGPWAARSVALVDSFDHPIFEQGADAWQTTARALWRDTLTGHILSASPRAWPTERFLEEVGQGAALVTFWGFGSNAQLGGGTPYFTAEDVAGIPPGSPQALWFMCGHYPFDVDADSSVALSLLRAEDRGAIALCVPAGLHFVSPYLDFMADLGERMTSSPGVPIGRHIKETRWDQIPSGQSLAGRLTLLGDPALVIASPVVAGTTPPGGTFPLRPELLQNYPNPFNPVTRIRFALPRSMHVTLRVYNALGQEVATLLDGVIPAGAGSVEWNAQGLASGVYLYRLTAGATVQTRSMVLLR